MTRAEGRRQALRDFLTTRRARVSPASAGLPAGGGRRRLPGLCREEVAVLAGLNPPPPAAPVNVFCEGLQRLIEAWDPKPATMLDASWNHVAWNESARLALSMEQADRNCLVGFFHEPRFRRGERRWQELAPTVVAAFRLAAAEHPHGHEVHDVVDRLMASSPEFAGLWARQDVQPAGVWINEVDHPVVGALSFESSHMRLPARPDLTVVLYNPLPDTDTADKIEWLRSAAGPA